MSGSRFADPEVTFTSHEALPLGARVVITSAGLARLASATEQAEAVTLGVTSAANQPVLVRLMNAVGTVRMLAGGSIVVGNPVRAAANGRITAAASPATGDRIEGIAYSPASDGTFCEVLTVNRRIVP